MALVVTAAATLASAMVVTAPALTAVKVVAAVAAAEPAVLGVMAERGAQTVPANQITQTARARCPGLHHL